MKPKTTILLVLAMGCGLAAAFMTQRILAQRDKTPEVENVRVVVAKKLVPVDKFIVDPDEYFEVQERPSNLVPTDAVRDLKNVSNIKAVRVIPKDEFVRTDDVKGKDQVGLEGKVPEGMRAVPIPVDPRKLANGLVRPEMRVDVIHTYRKKDGNTAARTILQNMLVLAVDNQMARKPDGQEMIIGQTVTLAATPEQAQHLQVGSSSGELNFSVRAFGDNTTASVGETLVGGPVSSSANPETRPVETVKPVENVKTVETVKTVEMVAVESVKTPEPPKPAPPKPIEQPKSVEASEAPKFHELVILRGDGSATSHLFPVDPTSGRIGIDVQKSRLVDDPSKPGKP